MKIQIINKDFPVIKEIFEDVTNEQISEFIKNNSIGKFNIRILE
jgi:hypothetical protein